MSTPKTPTYDKSHYSWQPASSQASQSIIEDEPEPGSIKPAPGNVDVTAYFHLPQKPNTPEGEPFDLEGPRPGNLPRRSTFNYKHESEEHKKHLQEEDTGAAADFGAAGEEKNGEGNAGEGRRGSITSRPFKPPAKRTKSWDYRDKRGEMQMTDMREKGAEGPTEGFTEI